MEISKEEELFLIERRFKQKNMQIAPNGIGVAKMFYKAKRSGYKFLDEATFIEKEGYID